MNRNDYNILVLEQWFRKSYKKVRYNREKLITYLNSMPDKQIKSK